MDKFIAMQKIIYVIYMRLLSNVILFLKKM